MVILILIALLSFVRCSNIHIPSSYLNERKKLIEIEERMGINHAISLNPLEEKVNARLLSMKKAEINDMGKNFPPHVNFLNVRKMIEKSPILKIMRMLPKGATLHQHSDAVVDVNWLVSYATYLPNCYIWHGESTFGHPKGMFRFFFETPVDEKWKKVSTLRAQSKDKNSFDKVLADSMTLHFDAAADADVMWDRFYDNFFRADGLINYLPVFREYCFNSWSTFYNDNVMHLELRVHPHGLYDEQGAYPSTRFIKEMRNSLRRFKNTLPVENKWNPTTNSKAPTGSVPRPGVFSAKIIYAALRFLPSNEVADMYREAVLLNKEFPEFVVGFDLEGDEDRGFSLFHHIPDLFTAMSDTGKILPLMLHAGETLSNTVGENLYDAVLLNSTRIGHGFALSRHPTLIEIVKEKGITIEVCPISNQVLLLVDDLRGHPARGWLRDNLPVVIAGDDSAQWNAFGVSHDFYIAFLAWDLDLSGLKKLALNSIDASQVTESERKNMHYSFDKHWSVFLKWFLEEF